MREKRKERRRMRNRGRKIIEREEPEKKRGGRWAFIFSAFSPSSTEPFLTNPFFRGFFASAGKKRG